jgi:hypothetical protein
VLPVWNERLNALFRAFFTDPHDLGPANQLIATTRIYLLVKENGATPMSFPDGSKNPSDLLFPHDGSYYEILARSVQSDQTWKPGDLKKIGG